MLKIRNGIFETNSSSSHSLSIGTINADQMLEDTSLDNSITLGVGEYGWEWEDYDRWVEKADYVAILLKEEGQDLIREAIHRKFPNVKVYFNYSGYIDHESDYKDEWMTDVDTLFTFFFGSGGVSTGNDNDDCGHQEF